MYKPTMKLTRCFENSMNLKAKLKKMGTKHPELS